MPSTIDSCDPSKKVNSEASVSIVDMLALPGDDIVFDPPRAEIQLQVPEFD